MKELEEPVLQLTPEQAIHAECKVKQESKYLGAQRWIPGLTLWQFNYKTFELKPAQITKQVVLDAKTQKPVHINKVQVQPNCIYRQAVNWNNAVKKMYKALGLQIK